MTPYICLCVKRSLILTYGDKFKTFFTNTSRWWDWYKVRSTPDFSVM